MDSVNEENSTPKRRRHNSSASPGEDGMTPVDRISNLPESVISHILSLLPTKSAVGTCVLSKNWSFRWTTVTSFDFDDRVWTDRNRPDPETRGAPAMSFVEFVNLVFANHTGSVHKLRLRWQLQNLRPVYLSIWLKVAISRNLRVLDLITVAAQSIETIPGNEFDLPAGFYACGTLEIAKIRGPIRVKLPYLVRLPKLTVLELICVRFDCNESVERLISACPLLETLVIEKFQFHNDLSVCKVASPKLRHLEICFHEGCQCDRCDLKVVIDAPSLENLVLDTAFVSEVTCVQRAMPINQLEIDVVCEIHRLRGDGVAGLVRACARVKVLKLQEMAVMALAKGTTPLPATFGRLNELVIEFPRTHWKNVMDLIDRCVKLEVLDINSCDTIYEEDGALEAFGGSYWWNPVRVPPCFSSSLKDVYIRSFEGLADEMALLKFLLDHGLVIETINLSWNVFAHIDADLKLNVLYEVSKFSRASATCKVLFS